MISQNRQRILLWIIAVLVIFNIATISTIFYHKHTENLERESVVLDNKGTVLKGKYFRHSLGFDNEQMDAFRNANRVFKHSARESVQNIELLKQQMFFELQKAKSDTRKLDSISTQIGIQHAELKKSTCEFYLNIKNVCTPEQLKKFESSFNSLFTNDGCKRGDRNHEKCTQEHN